MEKRYSNDDITIVWKPEACIHSTLCWRGLISVFNPRNRPWINLDGADNEAIIAQVEKCPSGALSWHRKNEGEEVSEKVEVETIVEATQNGPLMVYGNIKVKDCRGQRNDQAQSHGFLPLRRLRQQTLLRRHPQQNWFQRIKLCHKKGAPGCFP